MPHSIDLLIHLQKEMQMMANGPGTHHILSAYARNWAGQLQLALDAMKWEKEHPEDPRRI